MLGIVGHDQNTEIHRKFLYILILDYYWGIKTHTSQLCVRPDRTAYLAPISPPPEWKLHLCISMHGWSAIKMLICVFHQLDSFFCSPLLQKITFIISVSNTYWPGVTLWHVPTAYNHGCLPLSIPCDLSVPFLFSASTACRAAMIHTIVDD